MTNFDKWISNKIVQNVFVWTFLFIVLLSLIQSDNVVITIVVVIALLAPAIYVNNLLILPFLKRNKVVFFSLCLLNISVFTVIFSFIINMALATEFELKMFVNMFGMMVLALIFGGAIKIARDSFEKRQEIKEAELQLLKAQLNPHFLFNTLNNLYGLSVIKSDKLPNLMLQLSGLLRYSLYETQAELVSLEKEIKYIKSYVSLEQIRLEKQTEIKLAVTGSYDDQKIAPMLLIVFIENAFKHLGILVNGDSSVHITIGITENQLDFSCTNTVETIISKKEKLESGKSGIGLVNAKKRLNLMYSDRYQLQIEQLDNTYSIKLTLDL